MGIRHYVNDLMPWYREQVTQLSLPATSCGESPTVKKYFIFYSLAHPARSGERERFSVQVLLAGLSLHDFLRASVFTAIHVPIRISTSGQKTSVAES
jgi:hypothetical protein